MTESARWRIAPDLELDLCAPQMMGILNVTPDSFSDGGQFISVDDAVRQAEYMMGQGAAIIDVGGESTRPGAERIGVNEQVRRVVPVIESIRTRTDIPISIDTTLAAVANAALDAGATIINDVSAGLEDDAMLGLAADRACGIVLMHRLCPPDQDSWSDQYTADPDYGGDVVGSVQSWLLGRADAATQAGIHPAAICLDPGLGFGKSVAQNWQLIAHTHALLEMGYPLLVAASRKSFIGAVTNAVAPADRLQGSLAVTAFQVAAGARLLRVHDVGPHVQAAKQVLAG
jgi:dihydropteroate synthase